ncbi:hypothetical protein [Methylobacterium sp. ID0610]|uniref:hypothetical protein n=1 Tax=Methylobacterium carpenticola TaxID=3344827 RepID=UPI00369BC27A
MAEPNVIVFKPVSPLDGEPILDAATRERLGRELQALYAPVLDEVLDPRLAELLEQLALDRAAIRRD